LQLISPTINAQISNHSSSSSRSEFDGGGDISPAHRLQLLRQHDPSSSLRQIVEAVPPAAAVVDGAV
jgi:hypothetical protein